MPKTTLEIIGFIVENDLNDRMQENCKKSTGPMFANNLRDHIAKAAASHNTVNQVMFFDQAFDWENTKEGHCFWQTVHEKWVEFLKQPSEPKVCTGHDIFNP